MRMYSRIAFAYMRKRGFTVLRGNCVFQNGDNQRKSLVLQQANREELGDGPEPDSACTHKMERRFMEGRQTKFTDRSNLSWNWSSCFCIAALDSGLVI